MSFDIAASYDAFPYEGNAYAQSHPDTLATVAFLMGLTPSPIERCRVLELGCAMGANLVPMAALLPNSEFVGLDLSPRQIAAAKTLAASLGLTNIVLHTCSIMDVDDSLGLFDFIICHGVYSWVPPEVQDKILEVCQRNLAPHGIAYVSYNCYPGWHMCYVARELMLFHTRGIGAPAHKVREARAILAAFVEQPPQSDSTFHKVLKEQALKLHGTCDWYVCHDHLESNNRACYFHEFMERAEGKGLQFVGESGYRMADTALPATLREKIEEQSPTRIVREQYLDFATNRTFRATLLCHAGLPVSPRPLAQRLMKCGLVAGAGPAGEHADATSKEVMAFHTSSGLAVTSDEPIVKAALLALHEAWPRHVPFDELWQQACAKLPEPPPAILRPGFAMMLLQSWLSNVVGVLLRPTPICLTIGDRPVAFPVARLQATAGVRQVCNTRHHLIQLDDFNCQLVQLLDGTRDVATLRRELNEPAELEARLQALARHALVIA